MGESIKPTMPFELLDRVKQVEVEAGAEAQV